MFQIDHLSVESGWGGTDCYGELPQLYPWYAQVFDFSQPNCNLKTLKINFEFVFFRHLGPTHATDPILLHEINKFPDEAKVRFFNHTLTAEILSQPLFCRKLSKNAVDIGISYWGQRWVQNLPSKQYYGNETETVFVLVFNVCLGLGSGWQDCGGKIRSKECSGSKLDRELEI